MRKDPVKSQLINTALIPFFLPQRELQQFIWLIEKKGTVKDMENYHTSPIRVVAYTMPVNKILAKDWQTISPPGGYFTTL